MSQHPEWCIRHPAQIKVLEVGLFLSLLAKLGKFRSILKLRSPLWVPGECFYP